MLYTILPEEMKRVERRMMDATGTPGLTLMEHAATHVAEAAAPHLRGGGKLLVACGTGNNGGDGLAAARLLMARMTALKTVVWKLPGEPSSETTVQWERLAPFKGRLSVLTLENGVPDVPADVTCAIDALFGTGLNRPLEGEARLCVEKLNASGVPVVAVDIPSGLSGATGYPIAGKGGALAVRAEVTVTFHRPKIGLFLGDGLDCCGRVIVGEIGIPAEWDDAPGMAVLNKGDQLLSARRRNTHKGDYGRVLALIGSFGMAGAADVCATAALRTGAGLVTVACPRSVVPTVQALCPCATCLPLPEDDVDAAWNLLLPLLERVDALVAGCGVGREALAKGLMKRLIPWLCVHALPTVLDADALNLLAKTQGFAADSYANDFEEQSRAEPPHSLVADAKTPSADALGAPVATVALHSDDYTDVAGLGSLQGDTLRFPDCVVLTPHLGEAARLLGVPASRLETEQPAAARALRRRYGGSVVLKSASSVLIGADGEALNLYGTAAMAKGGSGDALAGILAALLAGRRVYGLTGVRLLQTACALHGMAGILAVETRGERGMLATDLCDALGRVPEEIERAVAGVAPHAQRLASTFDTETISMHYASEEMGNLAHSAEGKGGVQAPVAAQGPRAALGKRVRVTVDRPIGSRHPERREIIYGLNYGYVADVLAADNEWQDAYVFGVADPVEVFEGEVIAVVHRLNDVEDKWVVAAPGTQTTENEIRERTAFVEKFFKSEILLR